MISTRLRPAWMGKVLLSFILLLTTSQVSAEDQESWDAVFLSGSKIGYIHTFVEKVNDKGRDLWRVRVDMVLNFKRAKDPVEIELMYGTIETAEGEVLRLATRTLMSNQEFKVNGDVVRGQMKLTIDGGGGRKEQTIAWGSEVRGPYAAEQSLARKPPQEGESRSLKMFLPDLNRICDVTLNVKKIEEISLGDGSKRGLRRVEQVTTLDGKPRPEFNQTVWCDNNGQILKQESNQLGGMVTFRTTKEGAMAPNGAATFDQISSSVAKTKQKITNPENTRYVKYRITLKDDDPSVIFPQDRRQSIERITDPATGKPNPNSIFLTVKSSGPNDGDSDTAALDPQFLQPNAVLNSENAQVRARMNRAVERITDPWEKGSRINRWVFKNIRDKNFATTFATASEVARDLSGDCTEHAVLSAAMCRATGVPSRVVVGLVYVPKLEGFGYHMWNEVFVNQRWVALDASFDQTTVDAVHIKLSESSLDGVSPFEAFLPVARVLGKLEIEPLELR